MHKIFSYGFLSAVLLTGAAKAQTCATYPNTLTNNTTADASQVMANFNCAALLGGPHFTGNVGVGTASPTHNLDVTGNSTTSGYFRVGSNSNPTNTTAGDLTAGRLSLGNGSMTGRGVDTVMAVSGSLTATGTANDVLGNVTATVAPTATSNANFDAFYSSLYYNAPGINLTGTGGNAPASAWFENRIASVGTIADIRAADFYGLWVPTAAAALGGATNVYAGYFQSVDSFGNSVTGTVTNSYGAYVANDQKNMLTLTNQAGLAVENLNAATNNTDVLVGTATIPSGNFGIYDASTNSNYFAGAVSIAATSPLTYNFYVNGSAAGTSAWQNVSDARLKKDIVEITDGIDLVEQLRGVRFHWRSREEREVGKTMDLPVDRPQVGLIAQEVAAVVPEAVTVPKPGSSDVYSLKEADLIPVLIEAVKEQQAEIKAQDAKISELSATLAMLKAAK